MSTRRFLTTLVSALLALTLLASPAAAGANVVLVTDGADNARPAGDILALRLQNVGASITLRLRTDKPLNLETAAAWTNKASSTQLRWNLTTDMDPDVEYGVTMVPGPSGPSINFFSIFDGPTAPAGCVSFDQPQPTMIRVTVALSCLDGAGARAFTRYKLDIGGNGTIDSDDRAPNFGYSNQIGFVS